MPAYSKRYATGAAIAAVLNADADLDPCSFRYRKRPHGKESPWLEGAFVTPLRKAMPYHENSQDEIVYRFRVSISSPSDRDTELGASRHEAVIERVEEIFENKAHGNMPATIRALTATFASNGSVCAVQRTDVEYADPYVESAFRAGFDVSAAIVAVYFLKQRFDARAL